MKIKNLLSSEFTVVGHRGLPSQCIENTMESFSQAFKYTKMVELDVHLSLDNRVYVIHDFNLMRLGNLDRNIEDMASTEIKAVKLGSGHIPELDDVFSAFPDKFFLIELKTVTDEGKRIENKIADFTLDSVKSAGMRDNVAIISFDPYALRRTRELDTDILMGLDYDRHSQNILGGITGRDLQSLGISIYLPEYHQDDMPHYLTMQEEGYIILPWTVDSQKDGINIYQANLNGFITNKVDIMSEAVLKSKC
ncbi:MAG: glycerophosphodiester phosphodiesterase [Ferroplasma sp.]